MAEQWNVAQYEKFKRQRLQPAIDLMDLIELRPGMRIVDLGCGTGEITADLHHRISGAQTLGLDSSETMLAKTEGLCNPGLEFRKADIEEFAADGEYDLIFSNAAFQWVSGHEELFARLRRALRPGGQLALQIPKNASHPSQQVAFELEKELPFNRYPASRIDTNVLPIQAYASLLHRLGFEQIQVRMQVYLHELESRDGVVEWMKGTFLTGYEREMPGEVFAQFLGLYRERLMEELDDASPFLFTFNRILIHAVASQVAENLGT